MANATHARLARTATRLIGQHGRDVDLVTITNTGDAWNPTQTETAQTLKAVDTGFSLSDRNQWLIEEKDKALLIDANITPNVGQRVKDHGADYSIVNIRRVQPGEIGIIYKLQVRL